MAEFAGRLAVFVPPAVAGAPVGDPAVEAEQRFAGVEEAADFGGRINRRIF